MIEISFKAKKLYPPCDAKFFQRLLDKSATYLGLKKTIGLSINLVGPKKMADLNAKRGKKGPTDVLSFPLNAKTPTDDIMELGDIFLCPKIILKNAVRDQLSFEDMISQMSIHGLLHLLSYDHERSAKEYKSMMNLQDKIVRHNKSLANKR